ncbi:MAG: hypothetical protein ACTHNS_02435 [Marmoricola sp.]
MDRPTRVTEARGAWLAELDRLELDVLVLERRLATGAPPRSDTWVEPQLSVPLPPELVERARAIERRQLAALGVLRDTLDGLGRQRAVADRMGGHSAPERPVYLDTCA